METPGLLLAFAAGMLSFLSPCVLPLVPGYLSLMSGLDHQSVSQPSAADRQRLLFNALLFVLGFTIVFVAFGAAASGLGALINEYRVILTRAAGVIIIVMGLVMTGVLRSRILMCQKRFHVSPSTLGPFAAPVMGMAFAFGWTPCIGPILASVLTLAAGRETLDQGVGLLAVYSIGLGIPFIVMAVAFNRFRGSWQWFKRRGRIIDFVAGAFLVAFGVILLTNSLYLLAGWAMKAWTTLGFNALLG